MKTSSIRWRLIKWLAVLVTTVLTGFGTSVWFYTQFNLQREIDEALAHRVAALAYDFRRMGAPGRPMGSTLQSPPNRPPARSDGKTTNAPRDPADRPPAPPDNQFTNPDGSPRARGPGSAPRDWPNRTVPSRSLPDDRRTVTLSTDTQALLTAPGSKYYYAAWSSSGTLLKKSDNTPELGEQFPVLPAQTITRTRLGFREATHVTEREDRVMVGVPLDDYYRALWHLGLMLAIAGLAVLGVAITLAWALVTRVLRPVGEISRTAQRIAAGDLAERVRKTGDDELNDLADVLNHTFARLEAVFAEQKQFTADASHELRTPLSVIISEAQSALSRPRSPEDYRETLENCLEAAQDMRRLAESLLQLARLDSGLARTQRSDFDLAALAGDSAELIRPLAVQRDIALETELTSTPFHGDPLKLKQVLLNLLDNAIHYNIPGGRVHLTVRSEPGTAILSVRDTGQGIAPAALPHIFKRFFRADQSRTSSGGHSGLGLAIVKSIVDSHGGTITAESPSGEGSTFTVRLPLLPGSRTAASTPPIV